MSSHISIFIFGLVACSKENPKSVSNIESIPDTQQDTSTYPQPEDLEPEPEPEPEPDSEPEPEPEPTSEPDPECEEIHGQGEPLVLINECDTLSYGLYAAHDEVDVIHRLPDFSHAGYMGGGVAIPDVPVVITVSPVEGDDRQTIQDAIDLVSAMPLDSSGHRGAILLQSGIYESEDSLIISSSGVVLRGEGQGIDGTIIQATRPEQHDFILVHGSGSGLGEVADSRVLITTSKIPVGAIEIEVQSTNNFQIGDRIGVVRTPNQSWLDDLEMGQWGWTTSGYEITHERKIENIDGNVLTIDIPMVDTIDDALGGGAVFLSQTDGRIEQVGIENLRIVSNYNGDTDEQHGWTAIQFKRTVNSWVNNVTAVHFGYAAISIHDESNFNTVQNTAFLSPKSIVTGSRRYAFNVIDGVGNLFQRCFSEQGRHDFVTGSRVTGPNVWLDCYSIESSNDAGPHHRWATGLLFDNVVTQKLHVENRQDSGSGHGWSGAQTLFWNSMAEAIRCDAPKGSMNWTIGSMGEQAEGGWAPMEDFGWWESHGTPVEPRSLYLKQLESRLGEQAVQNVTIASQRQGRIWGQLASWAGEGDISSYQPNNGDPQCINGIQNGLACCMASCGMCGGSGCGSRPGGAEACCVTPIKESGLSCESNESPCILSPSFLPIGN